MDAGHKLFAYPPFRKLDYCTEASKAGRVSNAKQLCLACHDYGTSPSDLAASLLASR